MIANIHQYTYKQQDTAASYNSTVEYEELHLAGYEFARISDHPVKDLAREKINLAASTKIFALQMTKRISSNHYPANLRLTTTAKDLSHLRSTDQEAGKIQFKREMCHKLLDEQKTRQRSSFEVGSDESNLSVRRNSYAQIISEENKINVALKTSKEILTPAFKAEREKSLQKYLSSLKPKSVLRSLVDGLISTDLENLDASSLLSLVTQTKLHSAAFQVYLQNSRPSKKLTNMIISNIHLLVQEKYGCHLLRRLAVKSDRLMLVLCRKSLEQFVLWSTNEYSSRVMQTLASVQPFFRNQCMDVICDHWSELYQQVPIYYLLEICLKNSKNSDLAFKRVGNQLLKFANSLSENKALKKLLGLYLEYCDIEELTLFYHLLRFETELASRLDDKHYFFMLRTFFKRNFLPVKKLMKCIHHQGLLPHKRTYLAIILEDLNALQHKSATKQSRLLINHDDDHFHTTANGCSKAQQTLGTKQAPVFQLITTFTASSNPASSCLSSKNIKDFGQTENFLY